MDRPSHKELNGKLKVALRAVHENCITLIEPELIAADAAELGFSIRDELQLILLDLLNNTGPEHYAGNHPPQRSYEKMIKNLDLWAFSVDCPRLGQRIYYKFSIHKESFFLVSLHVCTSAGG